MQMTNADRPIEFINFLLKVIAKLIKLLQRIHGCIIAIFLRNNYMLLAVTLKTNLKIHSLKVEIPFALAIWDLN